MLKESCVDVYECVGAGDGAFLYARKVEIRDYLLQLGHLLHLTPHFCLE